MLRSVKLWFWMRKIRKENQRAHLLDIQNLRDNSYSGMFDGGKNVE